MHSDLPHSKTLNEKYEAWRYPSKRNASTGGQKACNLITFPESSGMIQDVSCNAVGCCAILESGFDIWRRFSEGPLPSSNPLCKLVHYSKPIYQIARLNLSVSSKTNLGNKWVCSSKPPQKMVSPPQKTGGEKFSPLCFRNASQKNVKKTQPPTGPRYVWASTGPTFRPPESWFWFGGGRLGEGAAERFVFAKEILKAVGILGEKVLTFKRDFSYFLVF